MVKTNFKKESIEVSDRWNHAEKSRHLPAHLQAFKFDGEQVNSLFTRLSPFRNAVYLRPY